MFSGFGGFNKPPVTSFDILANLTNGSNTNGGTKSDTAVTSSLFSSKKTTTTPSGGLFGTFPSSSTFVTAAQNTSPFASTATSPFASTATKTELSSMIFSSSKADSTVGDSPLKIHSVSSSEDSNSKPSSAQVTSTLFGVSSTSPNQKPPLTNTEFKQPVSSTSTSVQNSAPIATQISKPETTAFYDAEIQKAKNKYYSRLMGLNQSVSKWIEKHVEETPLCFLTPIFKDYENYLKEIQEEFVAAKAETLAQIDKKTLEEKPAAASKDSETSLFSNKSGLTQDAKPTQQSSINATASGNTTENTTGLFGQKSAESISQSPSKTSPLPTKGFSLGVASTPPATNSTNTLSTNAGSSASPSQGLAFGMKPSPAPDASASPPSKGFSFGMTPNPSSAFAFTNTSNAASPPNKGFSFGITSTPAPTSPGSTSLFTATGSSPIAGSSLFGMSAPPAASPTNAKPVSSIGGAIGSAASFSFGIGSGKPFSFGSQIQQQQQQTTETTNEDEDQPPKVEFTPVVEEDSVYDKKCKIFVKKDMNYVDKGVGTLYVKKIAESGKYQLLVRANTNLGTVLLNLVMGASVPTQRMGKNNVMLVCIPTPDAKPPPTPVLIRVKTGEEADELLETLNKFKS